MTELLTPSQITLLSVSVPHSSWGRDINSPQQARDLIDRYLYGGFSIKDAFGSEGGWTVVVEHDHYNSRTSSETVVDNQLQRLRSGGFSAKVAARYRKELADEAHG